MAASFPGYHRECLQRSRKGRRVVRPSAEGLESRDVPAVFMPSLAADDGAPGSLRAAIIASNANGQDDTIQLAAGTYQLTLANLAGQENAAARGDLDLTDANHLLTIQGAGAGKSIIDGSSLDRVFQIIQGVNVVLRGLTVRGGLATDEGIAGIPQATPNAFGGGILNAGSLTLDHVIVESNTASAGAGQNGASPGTAGSVGKSARGGGIMNLGTLHLTASIVRDNLARGGAGGNGSGNIFQRAQGGNGGDAVGGGILSTASLTIEQSTLYRNRALAGAAGAGSLSGQGGDGGTGGQAIGGGLTVAGSGGPARLVNTTLAENLAIGGKGGNGGDATASGGTGGTGWIGGGAQGGGLAVEGPVDVFNSTIAANQAVGGDAGGVGQGGPAGSPGEPGASTIPGPGLGGGVRMVPNTPKAIRVVSTLIANNGSSTAGADVMGAFDAASQSLVADPNGFTGLAAGVNGNLAGVDPRLEGLADNGGPVPTIALLSGSPAIDAGANPLGLATDARGYLSRAVNGTADIGAYETGARPPVQDILLNVVTRRGKRFLQVIDPTTHAVKFTVKINPSLGAKFSRQTRDVNGDSIADAILTKAGRKPITFIYSGKDGKAIKPPKLSRA